MKKIIASILAAFFVLLSPLSAFASTTESMMMFSTGSGSDEYSVMPLDIVSSYDLSLLTGKYNLFSDDFYFSTSSIGSFSNGDIVGDTVWYRKGVYNIYYDNGDKPLIGFSLGVANQSSSFSVPDGSTLSISIPNCYIHGWSYDLSKNFYLKPDAIPYRVYADMHFTATQQNGSIHSPTYHDQTIEISNFMSVSQNPYDNTSFDVNLQIPIQADTSGSTADRLYNINLRYIKIYAVYDISNFLDYNDSVYDGFFVGSHSDIGFGTHNFGDTSSFSSYISVNYSGGNSGIPLDTSTSVIQSSISNMTNSVTKQISQVKTQITQSTNTVTTKIDTMSQDIQTGLSNVVESAKQNTQNIINTVTQKVDEVKTGITEVKDSILDLPNKIQEMLLGLIVPDSDTMADKYSEFSGLLEEKLGVIYQIPMMLFDFFDTIVNAATTPQTTLTLPAFQLPWIDGTTLTVWQPMEYKIIPEGMQVLSDLIKTITSMTVVVLTFNSVKRAYERFLRS